MSSELVICDKLTNASSTEAVEDSTPNWDFNLVYYDQSQVEKETANRTYVRCYSAVIMPLLKQDAYYIMHAQTAQYFRVQCHGIHTHLTEIGLHISNFT